MKLSKLTFDDLIEVCSKVNFPTIEKLDDNLYKIDGVICSKTFLDDLTKALGLMYKDKLNNI